jgi:hypothetical protein
MDIGNQPIKFILENKAKVDSSKALTAFWQAFDKALIALWQAFGKP